ncbi:MAG: imidazole glycerol phosphate synthase subunit HisF [Myxococcaceae bacterium]|nr:imidazole glycerol phosphate synthase subunit HisF [Myxococcaceae bacterium]
MYRPRVIPVILLDDRGHAVKTQRFGKRIDLGDPVNAVSLFNAFRVDELVLLDIDASRQQRMTSQTLLADIAGEARMPFSVGGGIRSLEDIRRILSMGAEKVVLSSVALARPAFIREAADAFGSSSIVVCIDVKRRFLRGKTVYNSASRRNESLGAVEFARMIEEQGAGELILQSVDHDGTMEGYDVELLKSIAEEVSVPVIALGGAGRIEDLLHLYKETAVSALAAGSLFVFQDSHRGVMINYPDRETLSRFRGLR